jgi:hypothetical protein
MTEKRSVGRPKVPLIMSIPEKVIVFDQVLYWINLQATQEEVAGSFHVSVETLNGRLLDHFGVNFSELRKRCDGEAKLSLRRYQFNLAKTNTSMAIWLGKQWLGQKDHDQMQASPNDRALTEALKTIKLIDVNGTQPKTSPEHSTGDQAI